MSRQRTRAARGHHYDGTDRVIHPDGRPSCRWCRGPVPRPRRTFCSEVCVDHWKMRTSPSYLRARVWRRDRGICAECGVNSKAWARSARAQVTRRMKAAGLTRGGTGEAAELARRIERAALRALGLVPGRSSAWDADHIVPVAEGGGECDLSNLRTLCLRCHQAATSQLAIRLAAERRAGRSDQPAGGPRRSESDSVGAGLTGPQPGDSPGA